MCQNKKSEKKDIVGEFIGQEETMKKRKSMLNHLIMQIIQEWMTMRAQVYQMNNQTKIIKLEVIDNNQEVMLHKLEVELPKKFIDQEGEQLLLITTIITIK